MNINAVVLTRIAKRFRENILVGVFRFDVFWCYMRGNGTAVINITSMLSILFEYFFIYSIYYKNIAIFL